MNPPPTSTPLRVLGLDAVGFLIGISVFPVAIVATALRAGSRFGEDDVPDGDSHPDAPAPGPPAPSGDR